MDRVQIAAWLASFRSESRYTDYVRYGEHQKWRKAFLAEHPDFSSEPKDAAAFFDKLDFFSVENWQVLHNLKETIWPRLAAEMDNQLNLDVFSFEHQDWLAYVPQMRKALNKTLELLVKYRLNVTTKPIEDASLSECKGIHWLLIEQQGDTTPTPPYKYVRVESLFVPERFQSKAHQRIKGQSAVYNKRNPFELFVIRISRFQPTPQTPPAELQQFRSELKMVEALKAEYAEWMNVLEHPVEQNEKKTEPT
jgi:hypothetical protein